MYKNDSARDLVENAIIRNLCDALDKANKQKDFGVYGVVPTTGALCLRTAFEWIERLEKIGAQQEDIRAAIDLLDQTRDEVLKILGSWQHEAEKVYPLFG